ncbi:hypothetical protein BGZ72_001200, partial [Mortierella alpina]
MLQSSAITAESTLTDLQRHFLHLADDAPYQTFLETGSKVMGRYLTQSKQTPLPSYIGSAP